ncbi:MAG: insulinase family protein, partial [Verrucomicrobia bacterium]|nr:insulinase family protein [Verrucomicrobiota bacterium]
GTLPPSGEQVFVNIPDKASISVILGQSSGLRAGEPGWLALQAATHALGLGFTSRLIGNVRDREGLTYGISAKLSDDTYRPGALKIAGTFAPSLLEKGLTSTRREIEDWWKNGITADELAYHQSAMTGKFLVGLETTEGLATQLMLCAQRGFEIKWLDDFPAMVLALKLEEVNTVIKQQLDPAKMVTVKAGTVN